VAQSTLDAVRGKGFVQCGVNTGLAGFSLPDSKGVWRGIDVDVCRAVAAAVLGDAAKVRYTPLTAQQRFTALQSGEVDILSRNTTWTLTRDTSLGLNFVGVNYYDGQGFMVHRKLNVKSAKQLNGATVCVQPGTTTELNLADYFRANKMTFKPVLIEKLVELLDQHRLEGHLVKWVLMGMIEAEEYGITSKNVDEMLKTDDPAIKRFLGVTPGYGKAVGVDEKWMYNVIKQIGNYGESYDRNVGPATPLKLERGQNALWTKGGLMYAIPFR